MNHNESTDVLLDRVVPVAAALAVVALFGMALGTVDLALVAMPWPLVPF